jgi:protein phosphatase
MKIPPAPKTVLEQWMYQILWSDPQEDHGPKGRGTPFQSQHTKAFTDANNLAAVIRAHQVPSSQRGVAFHHNQRLLTIFTASNYCGSSQNYGGVAIFTPSLFPQLLVNRTLFEHWAPPLGITRDIFAKHQNATQDVRMFIAHEIETERAPMDRNNPGMLSHLQQKVAEYVSALIVQHRRQLWNQFYSRFSAISKSAAQNFTLTINEWESVCSSIIGQHFPWKALMEQLEIDLVPYSSYGGKGIDFVKFLNRFKANVRIGETCLIDTWEAAIVRGFFHEILSRDVLVQQALLAEYAKGPTISSERFREILQSNCPSISAAQASNFAQAVLETCPTQDIPIIKIFELFGEYLRAYFSLIESAPDIVSSDEVIETGRASIEFFANLRHLILEKYDNIFAFFKKIIANNSGTLVVSIADACTKLHPVVGTRWTRDQVESFLRFVSAEENEVPGETSAEISFLKFYGACYIDGSPAGRAVRDRIAEHANSAIYFHRNALRVACVHLDKSRCGQIDRHSFHRAFNALNQSLSPEWRLSKHQQRCVIEYLRWQENETDMHAVDGDVTVAQDDDKLLVIEYDIFLDSFEISDCQRMSRTCSFGWHLVKDTLGGLEDTIMQ